MTLLEEGFVRRADMRRSMWELTRLLTLMQHWLQQRLRLEKLVKV